MSDWKSYFLLPSFWESLNLLCGLGYLPCFFDVARAVGVHKYWCRCTSHKLNQCSPISTNSKWSLHTASRCRYGRLRTKIAPWILGSLTTDRAQMAGRNAVWLHCTIIFIFSYWPYRLVKVCRFHNSHQCQWRALCTYWSLLSSPLPASFGIEWWNRYIRACSNQPLSWYFDSSNSNCWLYNIVH